MDFPDQSHVNHVREALWQGTGFRASVMIGSGFSLNATKARPGAADPITWSALGAKIYNKLYPACDRGNCRNPASLYEETSVSILKIAQEYEIAFGRSELYALIQKLVRDQDFEPSDMHTNLLKLPWCDIFTTNWDTLLERACKNVVDRNYCTIHSIEEIPLAHQHRIVKLHGSLPAYFPLIVTEEDYRTYPLNSAPFVNTVQQAMMEKVFLLIGFSGDDPNFLHWSGWVRDNLGSAAPKVYLAGWLGLSPHRRRMLEDRNVVPIDLALHPKSDSWPENLRHRYATEWILNSLENGRAFDITDWPPEHRRESKSVPSHLQPVLSVLTDGPDVEPSPETGQDVDSLDEVKRILKIWAQNRKTYPGWLVAPVQSRHRISNNTDQWESKILDDLDSFSPVDRLTAVHELIWRRVILLEPITSALESAARAALDEIDCHERTVSGTNISEKNWVSIRLAWCTVALALVTNARYDLDQESFDLWIDKLSSFLDDDPDIRHQIHHEKCLWTAWFLDFKVLEGLLNEWKTEKCDTVWMIRKAALLFDIGRDDEATKLVDDTLNKIRKIPVGNNSVAGPSRESWCLWMRWQRDLENWKLIQDRWTELAQQKCNAMMERYHILDGVKSEFDNKYDSTVPPFDLGIKRIKGITYSNQNPTVQAYRAVRLSEVAGLPQSVNYMNVASELFKSAAEQLSISNAELAIRLVLRASNDASDKTLQRVLSRTRVASLEETSVTNLVESCENSIKYGLTKIAKSTGVFWVERMRVSLEVLSRLVLRLDTDSAESVFNKSLGYYQDYRFEQHAWLAESLGNLIKRSWESLPESRRIPRVLDLLSLPIGGLDNFHETSSFYPEPSEWLVNVREPTKLRRTGENRHVWEETIRLIVRGLRGNDQARRRASNRILAVVLWGQILKSESVLVAKALWENTNHKLPSRTYLSDWVFLILPEPDPGSADRYFRQKWLKSTDSQNENSPDLDATLANVGKAIATAKDFSRSFVLNEEEQKLLVGVIDQWADAQVPKRDDPYLSELSQGPSRNAIGGLCFILDDIVIPRKIGLKLLIKIQKLNDVGISGYSLITGLVRSLAEHLDELASVLRSGIVSDKTDVAEGAIVGLHEWLIFSTSSWKTGSSSDNKFNSRLREAYNNHQTIWFEKSD